MTIYEYVVAGGVTLLSSALAFMAGYVVGYSDALKWAGRRLEELYSHDQ